MAYEKQTWVNGDVITDDKLNHMEDGIESADSGALIVNITSVGEDVYMLDKTYNEIKSAYIAGQAVIARQENAPEDFLDYSLVGIREDGAQYVVTFSGTDYFAESADGYPSLHYD